MEAKDVLENLRGQLKQLAKSGKNTITIEGLQDYLQDLESQATESIEYRRLSHEGRLAEYAAESESNLKMFDAVLEAGKTAINALIVINGGAVVALFSALSSLAGNPRGASFASQLALPLLDFGAGVFFAVLSFGLRYFAQEMYINSTNERDRFQRIGNAIKLAAIGAGILGILMFAIGIGNSYIAIKSIF